MKNLDNKWLMRFLVLNTFITEWFIIANAIRHWNTF
jgi:hypothetical protein